MAFVLDIPKITGGRVEPNIIAHDLLDIVLEYEDGGESVHTPKNPYSSEILGLLYDLKGRFFGPDVQPYAVEYIPEIKSIENDSIINHAARHIPLGISNRYQKDPINVSNRFSYNWPFEEAEFAFDFCRHLYNNGQSEKATGMRGVSAIFSLDGCEKGDVPGYVINGLKLVWWDCDPKNENSFSLLPEHDSALNIPFAENYAKHNIERHLGVDLH